jgi:pilus assembly protein CpaB
MKGKAFIPLVLGLCLGLLAVRQVVNYVRTAQATGESSKKINAVVAVTDIDASLELTEEMLRVVEAAPSDLIPSAERITKLEDVVGRVTGKAIPRGSAVLRSMLAPEGTKPGMVARIEPGYRAFSVPISEVTGVAFQINPGDWVDVICVIDLESAGKKKETIAEVILQNVQVAAVGRSIGSATDSSGKTTKAAKSATLLVLEEEVPKLHLAKTRGKIALALRGDDGQVQPEGMFAKFSEVFRSAIPGDAQPVDEEPPPPPPAVETPRFAEVPEPEPFPVTVYRGRRGVSGARPERLMFQTDHSRTLLDMAKGAVSRTASMMMKGPGSRNPATAVPPKMDTWMQPIPIEPDDPGEPLPDEEGSESDDTESE